MHFRPLIITSLLLLCSIGFTYSGEMPFVILDSLKGKAEIQRAGQKKWILAHKSIKLYNNDIIRVLDHSHVKLQWQNGSVIYVNANSQILINLHKDTINNKLTNYATVFFGAVYFIVKKILPSEFSAKTDTKVYTPTAILAIRGTSFSLQVDKEKGTTELGMINGTVLVKNILKNQSLFLSAGYKTEIGINTDPIQPLPLLAKDIALLKAWVPPDVIIDEMNKQIIQARKDYATLTGKLEDKIVILPFSNRSNYRGKWNIQKKIVSFLATKIARKNRIDCQSLLDHKEDVDPIKTGIEKNARFVISGEIKRFQIIQKAEITAAADKYREHSVAQICINIQLIDVESKKMIYKADICEEVSGKNIKENRWAHIRQLPFDIKEESFMASILGKALYGTLDQSSSQIGQYIGISSD